MHKQALPIAGISTSILEPSDPCNILCFLPPTCQPSITTSKGCWTSLQGQSRVQPSLAFPLKTSDYFSSLVKRRVIVSVNQCRKQSSKCHFTCNSYNQLPWQPKYPVFRVKYNEYRAGRIMTYQDLQKDMRAQVVSKLRPLLSVQTREVLAEQGRTTKTSAMQRKATA